MFRKIHLYNIFAKKTEFSQNPKSNKKDMACDRGRDGRRRGDRLPGPLPSFSAGEDGRAACCHPLKKG